MRRSFLTDRLATFGGLRLHLVATLHGLPVGVALAGAKADERHVLLDILSNDPTLLEASIVLDSRHPRRTSGLLDRLLADLRLRIVEVTPAG